MPCNTDYYQDNARAWQGYAVEKCMTFNQQFNIGTFQLPAGIFQGWKFELPVPNIALEVQLCFPWFGISLGRISQIEIALILVDVEVLRLTWRWNNFGTGDFRFQSTSLQNTFVFQDIMKGDLRGDGTSRRPPLTLLLGSSLGCMYVCMYVCRCELVFNPNSVWFGICTDACICTGLYIRICKLVENMNSRRCAW